MPLFKALRERINIFTPKKPTQKPQIVASKASYTPNTTTASSSLAARLQTQSMSPDTRTEEWLRNNSPEKKVVRFNHSGIPSVLGVKSGGISKSNTPNSTRMSKNNHTAAGSSRNIASEKKRNSTIWNLLGFGSKSEAGGTPQSGLLTSADDRDIEGSTVVEDILVDDEETLEGPSILEGSTLLVQDEGGDLKVQNDNESTKEDEEEDFSEFSTEELFLFHKLNARGREPIIHLGWAMDFRTLPEILFTDDRKETYIKHIFAPEYHAIKAFYNLTEIGMRARDAYVSGIAPEKVIRRHLNEYFAWSMRDANLTKTPHIPILTITISHRGEPIQSVASRSKDRMYDMGRRYREAWVVDDGTVDDLGLSVPTYMHSLPTILGVIVKGAALGFISYDASVPGKAVKNLGVWDLTKEGQDVWHAFAIAIYMICARDYLLGLKEEGMLEDDVEEESDDPDA